MKNKLEGINTNFNIAKEKISKMKTQQWELLKIKQRQKGLKEKEQSLTAVEQSYDNFRQPNICVIGSSVMGLGEGVWGRRVEKKYLKK